jgi:hypothetical protein
MSRLEEFGDHNKGTVFCNSLCRDAQTEGPAFAAGALGRCFYIQF